MTAGDGVAVTNGHSPDRTGSAGSDRSGQGA